MLEKGPEIELTKDIIEGILDEKTDISLKYKTQNDKDREDFEFIINNMLHIIDKHIRLNNEFGFNIMEFDNMHWDVMYKLIEINYGLEITGMILNLISFKIENNEASLEEHVNIIWECVLKNKKKKNGKTKVL